MLQKDNALDTSPLSSSILSFDTRELRTRARVYIDCVLFVATASCMPYLEYHCQQEDSWLGFLPLHLKNTFCRPNFL